VKTLEEEIDEILQEYGVAYDQDTDGRPELKRARQAIQSLINRKVVEGKVEATRLARDRVLRRTEIPADAKNPTRDSTVILGEYIADIIQGDIDRLTAELGARKGDTHE